MQRMMREIQFENIIATVVLRTNIGTIKACPPRHLNIRTVAPCAESRSNERHESKKATAKSSTESMIGLRLNQWRGRSPWNAHKSRFLTTDSTRYTKFHTISVS